MSAKLNANASSFTPGGVSATPANTTASSNGNSTAAPVQTNDVLPPHMKKHAAEFWFPQSRNCACCKGYKHGCSCQASNNGVCASCAGN